MKIYATGRNVATRNIVKEQITTINTTPTSIKRPMYICPVLGYIHCSDWLNVWNVKGQ